MTEHTITAIEIEDGGTLVLGSESALPIVSLTIEGGGVVVYHD